MYVEFWNIVNLKKGIDYYYFDDGYFDVNGTVHSTAEVQRRCRILAYLSKNSRIS